MKVTALIIGIDGWETYTKPLIDSIQYHEPDCKIVVIDNASKDPYPQLKQSNGLSYVHRIERSCYSKSINIAKEIAGYADWYIVLSNDVFCTNRFIHILEEMHLNWVVGPKLMINQGWQYIEGWCVCIPNYIWNTLNGWDENYQVSSWEDVDFSVSALEHNFSLAHCPDIPFIHLDQKQRFTIIDNYWDSETHNVKYFKEKHSTLITMNYQHEI